MVDLFRAGGFKYDRATSSMEILVFRRLPYFWIKDDNFSSIYSSLLASLFGYCIAVEHNWNSSEGEEENDSGSSRLVAYILNSAFSNTCAGWQSLLFHGDNSSGLYICAGEFILRRREKNINSHKSNLPHYSSCVFLYFHVFKRKCCSCDCEYRIFECTYSWCHTLFYLIDLSFCKVYLQGCEKTL